MQPHRHLAIFNAATLSLARRTISLSALLLAFLPACSSETDAPAYGSTLGAGGSGGSLGTPTTGGTSTAAGGASTASGSTTTAGQSGSTTTGGASGTSSTGATTNTSSGTNTSGGFGFGNTGAGGTGSNTTSDSSNTGTSSTTGSGTTGGEPLAKFVGNITTGFNSIDTNGRTFSTYWDELTPENAGKWGSVQSNASSSFNWSALDAMYDYTQQAGIIFKEHTFVWGSQQPGGNIGETEVKNWMNEFCSRYPETRLIDVVNEPPPHTTPSYANSIGGGTNGNWQWIVNAFNWAHEACPNAILILNDYNNIEYGDQNQHFIDIVNTIKSAGAPIDAVGAQAHALSGGVSTDTMKNLVTKLHEDTGLPVYITEYDIDQSDDSAQLDKYQQHMPFFLDTEWIHGITIWGWIYGSTWVPSSGLIRNGDPRPAMTWLMEQLGRPAP